MEVITGIREMEERMQNLRKEGKTIGFVPTMGALHEGHMSLIRTARSRNDIVVSSIFVNPIQFNDKSDLERYPRTPENDRRMLENEGTDILFTPSTEEMYPESPSSAGVNFGQLDKVMEGAHRPGHFNGVAIVVKRLFEIVRPHNAYFGQKDFQQLAIIREMVRQLSIPVNIVGCPIIREHDGLAMSSRNVLLLPDERKHAPTIYKTLTGVKEKFGKMSVESLKKWVKQSIEAGGAMKIDYFEVADANSLQPLGENETSSGPVVGCIAVRLGKVRLIDNIILIP